MPSARQPVKLLVVMTFVWVLAGAVGIVPALMSPMMFDAPGSTDNPVVWVLFASVGTFPIACLVAVVSAWILHLVGLRRAAKWAMGLPLLNAAAVVGAFVWLLVVQGGSFTR